MRRSTDRSAMEPPLGQHAFALLESRLQLRRQAPTRTKDGLGLLDLQLPLNSGCHSESVHRPSHEVAIEGISNGEHGTADQYRDDHLPIPFDVGLRRIDVDALTENASSGFHGYPTNSQNAAAMRPVAPTTTHIHDST